MMIPKSKSKHNSDLRVQKLQCVDSYASALFGFSHERCDGVIHLQLLEMRNVA